MLFAIVSKFSSRLSANFSNFSRDWFGDLYREIKLHTLSPILISKFMHSWRKWISNILKGTDFRKYIYTPPCLALPVWSILTRFYPVISKLTSSDKIPLSKKFQRDKVSHWLATMYAQRRDNFKKIMCTNLRSRVFSTSPLRLMIMKYNQIWQVYKVTEVRYRMLQRREAISSIESDTVNDYRKQTKYNFFN